MRPTWRTFSRYEIFHAFSLAAAPTTQGVDAVAAVPFTADIYTGGAGKDTFIVGTNGAAAASDADVITDFVSKTDKIDFAAFNVAGSAANYSEASAAVADFTAAKTAADAAFAANGTTVYSVQQVGSDSYVFAADGARFCTKSWLASNGLCRPRIPSP